jgi:RHS repeat-associated protein
MGCVKLHTNLSPLKVAYQFNEKRGILLSRDFKHMGKKESFKHDELDRLTEETLNNAVKNAYAYDPRGRMIYNTAVGKYGYDSNNYRLKDLTLNINTQAPAYSISFNSYKAPTNITLTGKDNINFEYNPLKERSKMTHKDGYKIYTADKAFEMKVDKAGNTEVIAYIDGDPYSASYIQKTNFTNTTQTKEENLFLHRDYQQTILAITNAQSKLVEQRRFDAWGNIEEVRHYNTAGTSFTTDKILLTLDRGYTGHEHLQSVGLIHMNGRVYDPLLRRFLGPDNFVQDPFNTQNFNRYGYVLNNPLMYTDPSGETFLLGMLFGIVFNGINNLINGNPFWWGMGRTAIMGGISGGISAEIGLMATTMLSSGASGLQVALFQATAHGFMGAFMNVINGGDILSGFAAGAVSSLVSSGVGRLGMSSQIVDGKKILTPNQFGSSPYFKAAIIASGGLSGGLSSVIAGGNFWDGARQGLITAGLNHAMHSFIDPPGDGEAQQKQENEHPAQKAQRLAREKYQLKNISDPEKYPGIDIYQNQDPNDQTAVTLPGKGIYIGGGYQDDRLTMVTQHEYGHYLQYKRVGMWNFYSKIGLQSLFSFGDHKVFWTETAANRLAVWFFRDNIHPKFTDNYPLNSSNR